MYLASTIDRILESKKDKLIGKASYFHICDVLNRAFRKVEPFKFIHETYHDYDKQDYSVSGLYDMETDKKYVILNFSKFSKSFTVTPKNWESFKFSISQVCQHETIHQCQWSFRDGTDMDKETLEFRIKEGTPNEEQEYLADMDEIDAYGHDIAMEIKFFYPKKDPYKVLVSIGKHRKIWSYNYYKKTFKNEDWQDIRKKLLKKTYRWLPYV